MPPRTKSIPQRTCLTCRKVAGKRELVRLVRTPSGDVIIDVTGKKSGRGTYLCSDGRCWQKGIDRKKLEYALRTPITTEALQRLQAEVATLFSVETERRSV